MTVKEDEYDGKYVTFKQLEQSLIEHIALDALRGDNLYNSKYRGLIHVRLWILKFKVWKYYFVKEFSLNFRLFVIPKGM